MEKFIGKRLLEKPLKPFEYEREPCTLGPTRNLSVQEMSTI